MTARTSADSTHDHGATPRYCGVPLLSAAVALCVATRQGQPAKAERPQLSSRLTREKPSYRDEPLFAWPVGCSVWFGHGTPTPATVRRGVRPTSQFAPNTTTALVRRAVRTTTWPHERLTGTPCGCSPPTGSTTACGSRSLRDQGFRPAGAVAADKHSPTAPHQRRSLHHAEECSKSLGSSVPQRYLFGSAKDTIHWPVTGTAALPAIARYSCWRQRRRPGAGQRTAPRPSRPVAARPVPTPARNTRIAPSFCAALHRTERCGVGLDSTAGSTQVADQESQRYENLHTANTEWPNDPSSAARLDADATPQAFRTAYRLAGQGCSALVRLHCKLLHLCIH